MQVYVGIKESHVFHGDWSRVWRKMAYLMLGLFPSIILCICSICGLALASKSIHVYKISSAKPNMHLICAHCGYMHVTHGSTYKFHHVVSM